MKFKLISNMNAYLVVLASLLLCSCVINISDGDVFSPPECKLIRIEPNDGDPLAQPRIYAWTSFEAKNLGGSRAVDISCEITIRKHNGSVLLRRNVAFGILRSGEIRYNEVSFGGANPIYYHSDYREAEYKLSWYDDDGKRYTKRY